MEINIIRAWKDEEYRNSLTEEQRAKLPQNPVGQVDLSEEDLGVVSGGMRPNTALTQCSDDGCTVTAKTYLNIC